MRTVLCEVQCFSSSLSTCMLFVAHGSGLPGPHILLFSRSLLRRFSRFFLQMEVHTLSYSYRILVLFLQHYGIYRMHYR